MQHLMFVLLATIAIVTVRATGLKTETNAAKGVQRKIIGVALMHRHGARTGPQISAEGLSWGDAVLSPVGELMALGMGTWLRGHYQQVYSNASSETNWPTGGIFCAPDPITGEVPLSTQFCIGRDYNTQQVISQSTYFERTIRTAMGMLRGIFSNDTYGIPYIAHNPSTTDMKIGYYYTWPSAVLQADAINNYNPSHNNQTLAIMTQSELDEIGIPLNSVQRCRTQQTLCILLAQDVTSCNYANTPQGPDSPTRIAPALQKYWPRFRIAQQRSNAFLYLNNNPNQQPASYINNPSNDYLLQSAPLWERTGPYGRILTREIGTNFVTLLQSYQQKQAQKASPRAYSPTSTLSPLLYHYSAHDVTQYGIQAAIGGITVESMYAPDSGYPANSTLYDDLTNYLVPQFASILMFDLYDDGNISVSFSYPPQVYGADFTNYTIISNLIVRMTCITPGGTQYLASECPLDDFNRYVDFIKPLPSYATAALPPQSLQLYDNYDSYSYCYALPGDIAGTECDPTSTAVPTDPNCLLYRQVCPAFACDSPRFILNQSSWACVDNRSPASSNVRHQMLYGSKRAWFFSGTIIGSLVIGLFIGFALRVALYERVHQKGKKVKAAEEPILGEAGGNVNVPREGIYDSLSATKLNAPHTPTNGPQHPQYPKSDVQTSIRHMSGDMLGHQTTTTNNLSPAGSQLTSIQTTPVHIQGKQRPHEDSVAEDGSRPPLPIFST